MKKLILPIILCALLAGAGCGGPEAKNTPIKAPAVKPAVKSADQPKTVKAEVKVLEPPEPEQVYILADEIVFKSGLKLIGRIIKKDGSRIILQTENGKAVLDRSRIKTIRKTALPKMPGTGKSSGKEGLEASGILKVETWGNTGTAVAEYVRKQNKRLKLQGLKGDKDKFAAVIGGFFKLAGKKAVVMDVFNPQDSDIPIAIAISLKPKGVFYESKTIAVKPGWNRGIEIPLVGPVFKSEAANWEFKAALPENADAMYIYILVYKKRAFELIADNIFVQ